MQLVLVFDNHRNPVAGIARNNVGPEGHDNLMRQVKGRAGRKGKAGRAVENHNIKDVAEIGQHAKPSRCLRAIAAQVELAVVGQRLMRRICLSCRGPYEPQEEELAFYTEAGGPPKTEFFAVTIQSPRTV